MRTDPETLSREQLREMQWHRLRHMVPQLAASNSFWASRFQASDFEPGDLKDWDAFRSLPPVTKHELSIDQAEHPPFGSNLTFPASEYVRVHQTSGTTGTPVRWLDTRDSWNWFVDCWAQIYRLAGLTEHDRMFFPFSFGPFIGFWAAFDAANRLGWLSIPGGGLSSQVRLKIIADYSPTVVCCTPTYALRLAEVADEESFDLAGSGVEKLIVAGEPGGSIPATRERMESAWGARVFDHWGMTEIGSLGMEAADSPGGLEILEAECIAEIVDPQTLAPVAAGEAGELLITNLGRIGSPVIRYRTGDLVREGENTSPRELLRLDGGILGRADDMVTIRGNNVFPSNIEAILRRFEELAEYRITVETQRSMDHMRVEIEPAEASGDSEEFRARIARTLRDELNFEVAVTIAAVGSLPRFELKGRRFFRAGE